MEDIIEEMRAHGATCEDLKTTADELLMLLRKTDEFSGLNKVNIRKYEGFLPYFIDLNYKDRHGIDMTIKVEPKSAGAGFIIAVLNKVKE